MHHANKTEKGASSSIRSKNIRTSRHAACHGPWCLMRCKARTEYGVGLHKHKRHGDDCRKTLPGRQDICWTHGGRQDALDREQAGCVESNKSQSEPSSGINVETRGYRRQKSHPWGRGSRDVTLSAQEGISSWDLFSATRGATFHRMSGVAVDAASIPRAACRPTIESLAPGQTKKKGNGGARNLKRRPSPDAVLTGADLPTATT